MRFKNIRKMNRYISFIARQSQRQLALQPIVRVNPLGMIPIRQFSQKEGPVEDWQEYKDEKSPTGFTYLNVHTRERQTEKPAFYIPHDKLESPAIRFFKSDSFAQRGEPIKASYWYSVLGVFGILLLYDVWYGYGEYQFWHKSPAEEEKPVVKTRKVLKRRLKNEE